MNRESYLRYLKSDHWLELKAKKNRSGRSRCGICAYPVFDTHHLDYKNIYDVLPSDLRRMCRRCHFLAHDLIREGKLIITSKSHHGQWAQTKAAVKKALGLTGVNMFKEC